eukprot:scaffold8130_cov69-Phaeocystis_antarctica.AAC.4
MGWFATPRPQGGVLTGSNGPLQGLGQTPRAYTGASCQLRAPRTHIFRVGLACARGMDWLRHWYDRVP